MGVVDISSVSVDQIDALEPVRLGPTWARESSGSWSLPEQTLGWQIAGWYAEYVQAEDGASWKFTREQLRFVLGRWMVLCDRLAIRRDAVVAGHLRDESECAQARRAFRQVAGAQPRWAPNALGRGHTPGASQHRLAHLAPLPLPGVSADAPHVNASADLQRAPLNPFHLRLLRR